MDRLLDIIGRTCFWLFAIPGLYTGFVAVRDLMAHTGSMSLDAAAPFFFNVGFLFASLGLVKTKRMWLPAGLAIVAPS
jgi:hypothetical protein